MTARDLIAPGLYLLPALLFTVIARALWEFRRERQPKSAAFRFLPIATGCFAAHYFVLALRALLPGEGPREDLAVFETPWHALLEGSWLVMLPVLRHMLRLLPLPERRPGARWLAINYGTAAAAFAACLFFRVRPGATAADAILAHRLFHVSLAMLGGLCFLEFVRRARPAVWGPEHAGETRRSDVVIVQVGLVVTALAAPIVGLLGGRELAFITFDVGLGFTFAAPIAARTLGHVVPGMVTAVALVAATTGILAGYTRALPRVGVAWEPLLAGGTVLALLAVVAGGLAVLPAGVTRLLLRRRRQHAQVLQAFLHTLSPELGVTECCRRALAELVSVHGVPGAAILFVDGEWLVHGSFRVEPLARAWPRGAAARALPSGPYGSAELRELPTEVRDALAEASVGLGTAAIDSPRRRWGHLFLRTGFIGGTLHEDDADTFAAFVGQLAVILDAADLLARSVAVERSLAHAEKLAAIGELAARFAHDIRNPVTAARSLAQQLARDPTAPANAEHAGIILEELERVERQVRDLLRFARREEYRFEAVDLAELVRATSVQLRARCDDAGVAVEVVAPERLMAHVDREKMRHVIVNLIENAVDALAGSSGARRITLGLVAENGTARLHVADTGPGVAAEALPRLFEPFFSGKDHGTGLGLAIAKRTIDAHGGRIAASQRPGEGLDVAIELPVERAA